jgi:hypothetical protein
MSLTTTILEPLTHDEERERLNLERKVERAFYEAGLALIELRDKKLYRSTHKTFSEYCQGRFGFGKSHSYRLINAVEVVNNIVAGMEIEVNPKAKVLSTKVPNWGQNEFNNSIGKDLSFEETPAPLSFKIEPILPTTESQVRPLKPLEPKEQQQVWHEATARAKGVPSAKLVREVVDEIKGKRMTSRCRTAKNSSQNKSELHYVPIDRPQIGQQVRICSSHPLFPKTSGTITQLPNRSSAVVELNNNRQRELISLKDLEIQRIVNSNGHVSSPNEGINHVPGVGVEWYVRLDEETWHKLNEYAEKTESVTLGSAVARLLDRH